MSLARACLPAAAGVLFLSPLSQAQSTQRVSVDSAGTQADNNSMAPTLAANGRFVAFASNASNLVPGDTNGTWDIFLFDRQASTTERVSVDSAGTQGNGPSGLSTGAYIPAAISADGRYVAYESAASNLVAGDTNGVRDIFLRDRQLGTTERVSVDSAGAQGNARSRQPAISSDGRYVAFGSDASNFVAGDTNLLGDIFVRDRVNGTTECVSLTPLGFVGNEASGELSGAAISANGRYVAFDSHASNLVPGDTNGMQDIFVRDRLTSTTGLASVSSAGTQASSYSLNPSISADGRFVAFLSLAPNLVALDTNGQRDTFVRDRQLGTTERVSVDSNGAEGEGEPSNAPVAALSADGRFVVFSNPGLLVPGDTNDASDIFLRDRQLGTTERVSLSSSGVQGNLNSHFPSISGDGRFVAFASIAGNLVAGDTNGIHDVFLRDRGVPPGAAFCLGDGSAGACPCGNSGAAWRGCQNSASTGGAVLTGAGSRSLAGDTLVLTSFGELPTAPSIFLQGDASIAPAVFGDGLRCTGGSLKRLYIHDADLGVVSAPQAGELSVSARSAALGDTIVAGTTRYYQTYYRDPQLAFCASPPGNSWNVSSGLSVVWIQ